MKTSIKKISGLVAYTALSAVVAAFTTYAVFNKVKDENGVGLDEKNTSFQMHNASYEGGSGVGERVDLTPAAEKTVHAVVHIKSTQNGKVATVRNAPDIFDFFFGDGAGRQQQVRTQPRVGFGSGVILSKDGYIVTNNHVIDGADEIDVTLNDNRTFKGRLVGADENTDLALIKIETEDELPSLLIGNSEDLKVGEWVLAVGNPFNLTSTVTAGIVSAKARTLGIYNGGIESFIQTDAAINQGNSGGALVNAAGELVGINAVLSSPTGTYAGYGFAIPVTIMTKVVSDLKEFGRVQRALMGVIGRTVDAELNTEKDLGTVEGVYVNEVAQESAAQNAGVKAGDVIISIDGKKLKNMAQMQEAIAQHQPGDELKVTLLRDKKEKQVTLVLKNVQGNTSVVKNVDLDLLGAELKELNDNEKKQLNVGYGLKVTNVNKGRFAESGIKKGFVILRVNNIPMKSVEDLQKVLKEANSSSDQVLFISGMSPSGKRMYYSVDLSQG